ncbi:MAG: thiamine phosphate synthase [Selenomonadaceae bacterium]
MNKEMAMERFRQTGLYAITAECLSAGRTNIEVVRELLAAGIKFLQYREKEKKARVMYEECRVLRELTREAGAVFIIDDFIDLALAVDADGVHIGQDDLPPEVVRELVGPEMIIGFSTHNPAQMEIANSYKDIVDYFGVGPIYETHTKKDASKAVGLDYVRYAAMHAVHPFVAIGGIKEHNIAAVARSGASTIAVVSDVVGAKNIVGKIIALQEKMNMQ